MDDFEDLEKTIEDRVAVILAIQENNPFEHLDTMSKFVTWIMDQVDKAGLTGSPEGRVYFDFLKAELLFDAGYKGAAITTLQEAKIAAKKDGLEDYFTELSLDLQKDIDLM